MAPELQRITDEVLSLPTASRAQLARVLLDSLGSSATKVGVGAKGAAGDPQPQMFNQDIDQSWAREAKERVRQVDAGEVELLDGDEVLAEMRSLCR